MVATFQAQEPLGNFLNEISMIGRKGQFNEAMKLPVPRPRTPLQPFAGAPMGTGAYTPSQAGTQLPGGDLGRLMGAIRGQESSGNYQATNPSGALGAYQILWSNMAGSGRGWDKEALGRDVSREEFLSNPQIQDQIASHKLGQYIKSRGLAGAAATWYGGDWGYRNMYSKKPQGGYPSMYEYVMSILNRAGR